MGRVGEDVSHAPTQEHGAGEVGASGVSSARSPGSLDDVAEVADEASFLDAAQDIATPAAQHPPQKVLGSKDILIARSQDPKVTRALPEIRLDSIAPLEVTSDAERQLLTIFNQAFERRAYLLTRARDETLDVVRHTKREALEAMDQKAWLQRARERISPERLAEVQEHVATRQAKRGSQGHRHSDGDCEKESQNSGRHQDISGSAG